MRAHNNTTALVLATIALLGVACGGSPTSTIPDAPVSSIEETAPPEGEPTSESSPASSVGGSSTPSQAAGESVTQRRVTCLGNHYLGVPNATKTVQQSGGWVLRLPDATELAWDDGTTKSYDQMLATPDLEDTLSMPYTTGPIVPVTIANRDAGRIRHDALFKATFGGTESEVKANLVDVDFVGQKLKFHQRGAAALGKVSAKLTQLIAQTPSLAVYVKGELGGTFQWRPIANTSRLSAHSYGIAIDINVAKADYWEWEKKADGSFTWKNSIPQAIVDAFEAEGFIWGGRWHHFDTMHFEYRPELFDAKCL